MDRTLLWTALATLPVLLLAGLTWRLIWPPWKRAMKLVLHPSIYAVLAALVGPWAVAVAWLHQGLGLAGHIWFSRRHGFTWYAVEDPEEYVRLSRETVGFRDDPPGGTPGSGSGP